MGDINKKLKEEIDFLSRLINTHRKQETCSHPAKPLNRYSGSKNFRRNSAFSNFPYSNSRNQIKNINGTNINNKLVKSQNVKKNPYKIDRTVKNNRSAFTKTQYQVPESTYNNPSHKMVQFQNTLSERSVVVKPSVSQVVPHSVILDTVAKQTPVLTTRCDDKSISKNLPIGIVANKWIPDRTTTKAVAKALQITAKPRLSGFDFPANKFVFSKSQSSRLIRTPKNNLVVKTKYKVINSEKHQKFKSSQNHYFQSKQIMGRRSFQNVQNYSLPYSKIVAKKKWNTRKSSSLCYNFGYQYSNWKNSYYGRYKTSIFKKRAMQRKRWKMQFAASHRKFSTTSCQIANSSTFTPRMVTIGGLLYKASKMKLSRASKSSGKQIVQNRMKLQTLLIRGIRYQMDPSRKTLKRVSSQSTKKGSPTNIIKQGLKRIDLGGSTYIQTQPGVLTKTESAQARTFVSRVVNRSIYRVLAATEKKLRSKNNLYCMFYNRFGRCNKGSQCPYKHDPDKIAVCVRFLRGTCKVVDCPFSHKVAPEKMPVCSFYLQGRCNNDNCPYRHVKVSRSAEVCRDFLRGYCPAGEKCKKRHMLVCQEFTQKGSCTNRSKCLMHHPPRKGQKRKHSQCSTSVENPVQATSKQCLQLMSDMPSDEKSVELPKVCLPLPSYIALEKDEKKEFLPITSASTVKGEALRIRPYFLSKGTLGVTLPVSQVSKNTK